MTPNARQQCRPVASVRACPRSGLWVVWLAALLIAASGSRNAHAANWQVDQTRSRVGFIASYDSIQFPGTFTRWDGVIRFDPNAPENGELRVDVDMASVDTKSKDRDAGIRSGEWFDASGFGTARYRSVAIRALGNASFSVEARFEIKGREYPLISMFTWQGDGSSARLQGRVEVDRRTFAIGTGEWAEDPIIGFKVIIEYDLHLTR